MAVQSLGSRRSFLVAVLLALVAAAAAAAIYSTTERFWLDLAVYRQAGHAVRTGEPLYEFTVYGEQGNALRYVYPPFAAILFVPLAAVGPVTAVLFWTFGSLLALVAAARVALRAPESAPVRGGALAAAVAVVPLYPIVNNLQVGQVNLVLMLLVLADLLGVVPARWRGAGIGVAAAVKLTPAIFVVYLLATGRPRDAARAGAAFAAATAVGFLFRPGDSLHYWSGVFADSSRVAQDGRTINNQSLSAALARVFGPDAAAAWWLPLAVVVAGAGVAVAARAARQGFPLLGAATCAVTGLLVSPVSWQNHWVWFVPMLLLLAGPARAALWLLVFSSALWMVVTATGNDNVFTGPMLGYANLYVLIGLVWLAGTAWFLRRTGQRAGP